MKKRNLRKNMTNRWWKHDLKNHFVPDFDQKIEALVSCLSVWVLHGGQKPRHRLPGDHLHLLGHPRPVHSKCKELKRFLDISIFNSSFKLFRKMPSSNLPLSSPTGSYDVFQVISISCLKIKSVGTGTLSFKLDVNLLVLVDLPNLPWCISLCYFVSLLS